MDTARGLGFRKGHMILLTIPVLCLIIAAVFFFMASASVKTSMQLVPLGLLFATLAWLFYNVVILVRAH